MRLTRKTMGRAVALMIVLTFAGTPAATAVCLVWCGSLCPPMPARDEAGISTGQRDCAELLVIAPVLREDTRREAPSSSITLLPSLAAHTAGLPLQRSGASFNLPREHAPPIHQTPPTVLRR